MSFLLGLFVTVVVTVVVGLGAVVFYYRVWKKR